MVTLHDDCSLSSGNETVCRVDTMCVKPFSRDTMYRFQGPCGHVFMCRSTDPVGNSLRICMYLSPYIHACMDVYMSQVCMQPHALCVHFAVPLCVCMYTHAHTCANTHTVTHPPTHTYALTQTHIHTHPHTYTHKTDGDRPRHHLM